jgi:hypothetical protein
VTSPQFEAVAGVYDPTGRLLGTGRFIYHLDESAADPAGHTGPPDELEELSIPLPAGLHGGAVSAAVALGLLPFWPRWLVLTVLDRFADSC